MFFKKNFWRVFVVVLFCFFLLSLLALIGYLLFFNNRAYPNVYLANTHLGGLTKEEAKNQITNILAQKQHLKVTFLYQQKQWEVASKTLNLQYNPETTLNKVWLIGRQPSFWQSFKEQITAPFCRRYLEYDFTYDQKRFREELDNIEKEIGITFRPLSFRLENEQIKTIPPKAGLSLNRRKTEENFRKALGRLETKVEIAYSLIQPNVSEAQAQTAKQQFSHFIADNLIFKWENKKFTVKPNQLQEWVQFEERPTSSGWTLVMVPNENKIREYLGDLARNIDQEPINAKLAIGPEGKLTVLQPEQPGYQLDQNQTLKAIKKIISEEVEGRTINLGVTMVMPEVRSDNLETLGIKELLAEGVSDFKNSPKNRIHNITLGASLFHGVVIKPEEVFSFNQVLGEISPQRGFLPELVIKEDRLIPETGGGLCQVSTTMFRAAINAGLEILERTPHAFRVRYYEPPVGLDATIYIPKPDLKFKNDTPGHILIQTKIEGTKLIFQFYGTKDGRKVEIKGPYTSNYRAPGPPVYIDDPSLPAGTLKQIERAVAGLTAKVEWTVYKDGKILHQKTFISKYVPWPAKYKRGTAPQPPPAPNTPTP